MRCSSLTGTAGWPASVVRSLAIGGDVLGWDAELRKATPHQLALFTPQAHRSYGLAAIVAWLGGARGLGSV